MTTSLPEQIGTRYVVLEQLGRGGMGVVYRVRDRVGSRELALKTVVIGAEDRHRKTAAAMLEREYHVLAQLSHPRVIEVYEFGITDTGPHYTMELLEGVDLRDCAPLPWRTACSLFYDVASCLALLHSRRIVHRDITPRNVRCTPDGHAKLMDFGAMVPMGLGGAPVGTPPFMAPEVVRRASLDARTDLFSLGATLYYALTGRTAYPASDLASLESAWQFRPVGPSVFASDIPSELDALALSLLALEPSLRPRSAAEVMQRLNAIADLRRVEPPSVMLAYLATPMMVGRAAPLERFRSVLHDARRTTSGRSMLVQAAAGLGRSGFLNACALEATTLGYTVLRADAATAHAAFAVAHRLAEQALELLPGIALEAAAEQHALALLFDDTAPAPLPAAALRTSFAAVSAKPGDVQRTLAAWLGQISEQQPLLVAVDDVDRIDEPSAALLATLAHRAAQRRLVVLTTSEPVGETSSLGVRALAGHSISLELPPLSAEETSELLTSLFGDVPGIALLSDRLYTIGQGRPRFCMDFAQHLIDRGLVRYSNGSWTLPSRLSLEDLPQGVHGVLRERVRSLGALARSVAQAHALSTEATFSLDDYALLLPADQLAQLQDALLELVRHSVLATDGLSYIIAHPALRFALIAELDPDQLRAQHSALVWLYRRTSRPGLAIAFHALSAGEHALALDHIQGVLRTTHSTDTVVEAAQLSATELTFTFERAIEASLELQRPLRETYDLRRWAVMSSIAVGDQLCVRYRAELQAQLELDSGFRDYCGLNELADPQARLMAALTRANERYTSAPERERVFSVEEGIRFLAQLVVVLIPFGARCLDAPLLLQIPALIEPFAPLSPLLDALWQNTIATCDSTCYRRTERALERWRRVYERLGTQTDAGLTQVTLIRQAVAYAIGLNEARLGIRSAAQWADILDDHPQVRVNAMYLRKIICLQYGDFEAAESYRRQAELISAQSDRIQVVTNTLSAELWPHAAALDLTGLREVRDRLQPLAERYAGWRVYAELAEGYVHQLCGDADAALRSFDRALHMSRPDSAHPTRGLLAYPSAAGAHAQALLDLGRYDQAKSAAEIALAHCREIGNGIAEHDVARVLALAEARLGDFGGAAARLLRILEEQIALGIEGLNLGITYETRARVAIWAQDRAAIEHFGRLAAREYRHGKGSPLGRRYERLQEEARTAHVHTLPPLHALEASTLLDTSDS